ncbi:MAG TPA: hypothetical protein DCL66_03775 [Gammaproteobacteria bacterium]|nr:hypothetical protein [Gammaproteobacteria bacterium]
MANYVHNLEGGRQIHCFGYYSDSMLCQVVCEDPENDCTMYIPKLGRKFGGWSALCDHLNSDVLDDIEQITGPIKELIKYRNAIAVLGG